METLRGVSYGLTAGLGELGAAVLRSREAGLLPWDVSSAFWDLHRATGDLQNGVVFTPPTLAKQVIDRLDPGFPVVDFGAGTGMLSLAAAQHGFSVTAIDIDAQSLEVLEVVAECLGLSERIRTVVGDVFSLELEGEAQVMANPPYTRHQSLCTETKQRFQRMAGELGISTSLAASAYVYFMIHAWNLAWSRREVLLVPTNWLEAAYGGPLRQLFLRVGAGEIWIDDYTRQRGSFTHAISTACVVSTRRAQGRSGRPSQLNQVRLSGDRTLGRRIMKKWHREIEGRHSAPGTRLGDIFDVHRGIATGANSFFVLAQAVAQDFPAEELLPALPRLSALASSDKWFLWKPTGTPSRKSLDRIRLGALSGVAGRYLCSTRKPWWAVPVTKPPDFILSYMGRNRPIVARNPDGLLNLNNTLGLYRRPQVDPMVADSVADWLVSDVGCSALLEAARHLQRGLWKLEPGSVGGVTIPPHLAPN